MELFEAAFEKTNRVRLEYGWVRARDSGDFDFNLGMFSCVWRFDGGA